MFWCSLDTVRWVALPFWTWTGISLKTAPFKCILSEALDTDPYFWSRLDGTSFSYTGWSHCCCFPDPNREYIITANKRTDPVISRIFSHDSAFWKKIRLPANFYSIKPFDSYMTLFQLQETHRPHCSPEKKNPINKHKSLIIP